MDPVSYNITNNFEKSTLVSGAFNAALPTYQKAGNIA